MKERERGGGRERERQRETDRQTERERQRDVFMNHWLIEWVPQIDHEKNYANQVAYRFREGFVSQVLHVTRCYP